VPCPNEYFSVESGVRLRAVPEMGACLAYTSMRPALHRLNAASWLIVSLCDGRPLGDIAEEFRSALGNEAGSEAALQRGLAQLVALGVIRRSSQCSDASAHTLQGRDESHD
jgi:hypothetical protein